MKISTFLFMFDLVVAINGESYSDMIMIKKTRQHF